MIILFDGTCGFCTLMIYIIAACDRYHQCLFFPAGKYSFGLSKTQLSSSIWVIQNKEYIKQGEAVCAIIDILLGISLFQNLCRIICIKRIFDAGYIWVANHRTYLPGMKAYCESFEC